MCCYFLVLGKMTGAGTSCINKDRTGYSKDVHTQAGCEDAWTQVEAGGSWDK